MAKQNTKSTNSRIRFVLLEAEVEDGDFSQITQAIQNALGPRKIVQTQIVNGEALKSDLLADLGSDEAAIDEDAAQNPAPSPAKNRSPAKRTFPTPEVVDVNWGVVPTIEDFTNSRAPKTANDRFLLVLAWFKEASGIDSVSVNQVYTAFRKLKWSTAIKDFSQPLRDLKGQQVVTGGAKTGFTINHLGLARVEELMGGG